MTEQPSGTEAARGRNRWRSGLRPALVTAGCMTVLGALLSAGEYGFLAFAGAGVILFAFVLLLYAVGLVQPTDTSKKMPASPRLLIAAVAALAVVAVAQCS